VFGIRGSLYAPTAQVCEAEVIERLLEMEGLASFSSAVP
jgi:hypothetical protein